MANIQITTCPICAKNFIPTMYWVYKKQKDMKTTYFCSYHCFRKAGGGKGKFKNTPKKRGKLYA